MTAPIAIQSPHIDPGIFQRSSGGGESGLEPLIAALQFYKKSKLEEQKNQIDAVRAGSEANFQSAYADRLRADVKSKEDAQDAWNKTVAGAPATLQPFLHMIDGLRGLDPELQHVVAPVLARQIPGFAEHPDPAALVGFGNLLHNSVPMGIAAKIYNIDLDALGVPKSYQTWQYTPPGEADRTVARQQRATATVFSQADKEMTQGLKAEAKMQEDIATRVLQARQPRKPLLVTPKYDPSDTEMRTAYHQWLTTSGWGKRKPILMRDREEARTRLQTFAGQQADAGNPAGNMLQSVIDLMSQPQASDTIPPQ